MTDVILERQTFILVTDNYTILYPANDLYPSNHIFPATALKIENIVAGSMSISEILSESTIQLGQMFSTKFECQVYQEPGGQDIGDLSSKYITVFQTEGNEYRVIFTGQIDSCKIDRLGYDRKIVAYDAAYRLSYKNVAGWWTSFWTNRTTATVKQMRESLLGYMELNYIDPVSLPNDNVSITAKKTITIKSISFCDMLKMICEIQCCFPHFTRTGTLKFVVLNNESAFNIDTEDYESESTDFEQYTSDAYTGIQFYNSGGTILYTEGTDACPYSVAENVLMYGLEDSVLHTIGQNMLNAIRMLIYRPGSVKMVVSNFRYNVGDYIVTERGFFYIFKIDFSGSQLVEQTLKAEGTKTQDEVGVDIDIAETVIEEILDDMDREIGEIYDKVDDIADDVDDQLDDLTEEVENTKVLIERGDDFIRSTIADTSGEDVWHVRNYGTPPPGVTQNPGAEEKYNITISYMDYGEPYANLDTVTTEWSSHGISDYTEVEGEPHAEDYDQTLPISENTDNNRIFMDTNTGIMYQYMVSPAMKKSTKLTGKTRAPQGLFRMYKMFDGVVKSTTTEWDIFPYGASVGDYYLDIDTGKIYRLNGNSSNYYWTYMYDCPKTKAVYETMIEQNSREIILEASRAATAEGSLSSRISVSAFGITMETEGAGTSAGIRIRVVDENGDPIQGNEGNILLTGLVKFSDLEGGSTTIINGGTIETNTVELNKLLINDTVISPVDGSSTSALGFSTPIKTPGVETTWVKSGGMYSTGSVLLSSSTSSSIHAPEIDFGQMQIGGLPPTGWDTYSHGEIDPTTCYCSSKIRFKSPMFYPVFPYLKSSSQTGNIRCQTGSGDDIYRFAPIVESSQRWKHDIKPIEDENLDPHKLYDLEVDQFIYNLGYMNEDDARFNTPVPGFIAEKVADVYPIAVDRDKYNQPANWNERFIIPPMLKLIQELNERITVLEEEINQLKGGK